VCLPDGSWRYTENLELQAAYIGDGNEERQNRGVWDLFLGRLREVVDGRRDVGMQGESRILHLANGRVPGVEIRVRDAEPVREGQGIVRVRDGEMVREWGGVSGDLAE
jgi:hypothetical protein